MVTTLTQDVYLYIEQHTPIERLTVVNFFMGYDIESIIDVIDYLFEQELINMNGTLLSINKGFKKMEDETYLTNEKCPICKENLIAISDLLQTPDELYCENCKKYIEV